MNLIEKIFSSIGFTKKSNIQNVPLADGVRFNSIGFYSSGKKLSSEQAMKLNRGWTYACVRAIAEGMAQMQFKLYRIKNGEKVEVKEHAILDLLTYVNDFTSSSELKYLTSSYLELTGNAYWLLEKEKENQEPTAIYVLNPKYVTVEKAGLPTQVISYKYKVGDQPEKMFQTWQIIHLRYPDVDDPYEGIGTVEAIREWIDLDNWITEINRNFFKNGIKLSGTIETEQSMTPEVMEYIKHTFQEIYKGASNSYQVAVMPNGTKLNEKGATPKDMDFPSFTDVSRDRILAGFRVPKTVLATAEASTNRATAETATYVFAALTLKPKMQHIAGYLNEYLVPMYGDDLVIEFDDPVPENTQNKIEEMQAAMANQPIISLNEARQKYYGLEPVENGDSVMTDFSKTPVGVVKPKPKSLSENQVKIFKTKKQLQEKISKSSKNRKDLVESISEKALEAIKSITPKVKNITEMTDEEFAPVHKAFISRVTPFENAQKEVVQKFNAKQQKEVLKNLPKIAKTLKAKKTIDNLFDEEENIKMLIDLSLPIHKELYGKEATQAGKLIGASEVNYLTPEVLKAIDTAMKLMSESYNATTIDLLSSKLTEGISSGEGITGLTKLVSQVYEFSDQVRAETVARTEAFRTANDATRDAMKQSGVVKTVKWYTASDEAVCEDCGPMNGTIVDINDKFFEDDYGSGENPPLHVNCRCYIRPDEISADKSVGKIEEKELTDEEADSLINKMLNKNE